MVELVVFGDVFIFFLAIISVLVSAISRLIPKAAGSGHSGSGEPDRAPKIEDAEDQSDDDQIPGAMANGPGGEEQFGNTVKGRADGDVFQHQKAVSQQEKPAGHASHQHLPGPAQIPVRKERSSTLSVMGPRLKVRRWHDVTKLLHHSHDHR